MSQGDKLIKQFKDLKHLDPNVTKVLKEISELNWSNATKDQKAITYDLIDRLGLSVEDLEFIKPYYGAILLTINRYVDTRNVDNTN